VIDNADIDLPTLKDKLLQLRTVDDIPALLLLRDAIESDEVVYIDGYGRHTPTPLDVKAGALQAIETHHAILCGDSGLTPYETGYYWLQLGTYGPDDATYYHRIHIGVLSTAIVRSNPYKQAANEAIAALFNINGVMPTTAQVFTHMVSTHRLILDGKNATLAGAKPRTIKGVKTTITALLAGW